MIINFAPHVVLTRNGDVNSYKLALDLQDTGNTDFVTFTYIDDDDLFINIKWEGHGSNLPSHLHLNSLIDTYTSSMTIRLVKNIEDKIIFTYDYVNDFVYNSGRSGKIRNELDTLNSMGI